PAVERRGGRDSTGEPAAPVDARDAASEAGDVDRDRLVLGRAVAQLALAVQAPALQAAVLHERACVVFAGRELSNACGQALDGDGRPAVDRRSVSDLAGEVRAPAFRSTVLQERATVEGTHGDRAYAAREAGDIDGGQ